MLQRSTARVTWRDGALRVSMPHRKQGVGAAVDRRREDRTGSKGTIDMLRFMVRVLGLWCLAGGFAAAMIDGMKSIAASKVAMSTAAETWGELAPGSFAVVGGFVEARLGVGAWAAVKTALATVPTWVLLGVVGALLVAVALPIEDEALPPT